MFAACRFQAVFCAVGLVAATCSGASAQKSGPAPGAPKSATAVAWSDCRTTTEPNQKAAIAEAETLLARLWRATEGGHFAAYTMPGETRNPFDLTPKAADAGPRDGIVQARAPVCTSTAGDKPDAYVVRFTSPYYRFYEAGPGWSAPLADGLMLEASMEQSGEKWYARDVSGERAILLPEQKPRLADVSQLPPDAKWAAPMTGCPKRTKWNGETCAGRKR